MTKPQLIVNPGKEAVVKTITEVVQEAVPETYTVTMTKRQLMFFHKINACIGTSEKESMGYDFYEKLNKIDSEFNSIGKHDINNSDSIRKAFSDYTTLLKSLGLD